MKAQKYITVKKEINIKIKGITLLSIEEYEKCRDIIPVLHYEQWWLRSPGYIASTNAAYVRFDGAVGDYGSSVDNFQNSVRPALFLKSPKLQIGDKIELFGLKWTAITNKMIVCDKSIGYTHFRGDRKAADSKDFEKSDIKKWLENWLKNKMKKKGE